MNDHEHRELRNRAATRMTASISVALATYNGARFIREQLDSIAAQTVLPAELVVTDDASSDDTVAIVEDFARTAPFSVRVHCNAQRLGYRANFMHNLALCTSPLIALCDQDDVWMPEKLEEMHKPFADTDVLLCFHEAWLINSAGARTGEADIYVLPRLNPPLSLYPMRNPFGFAMMIDRRLLALSDLWMKSIDNVEAGHRMAHDQWLFFLASVFGTIVYLDQPLAGYRQHGANTYGIRRQPHSRRDRIAAWINQAIVESASFGTAAGARAAILEEAVPRLDRLWAERARTAAVSYRELADQCGLRSRAYGGRSMAARVHGWIGMVRGNVYGKRTRWAHGRKTAIKDLSYLVLPASLGKMLAPAPGAKHDHAKVDIVITP